MNKRTFLVIASLVWAITLFGLINTDMVCAREDAHDYELTVHGGLCAPMDIPLNSLVIRGTPIAADGTTNPGIAEVDNVPAVVWASGEETPVSFTFTLPKCFRKNLTFRLTCSTSNMNTPPQVDWKFWVNTDDTAFDASATAQTAVAMTNTSAATQNEVVELTLDSTGQAALKDKWGSTITVDIFPSLDGGTLELKRIQMLYEPY